MRRLRLICALGLAVGAPFGLVACGGDDSPEQPIVVPTETVAPLSKAEFIQQADAVCEEANTAIAQFAAAGEGVTEADQIAQLRQGVIDEIQSLGPPDEDRRTLDDFLAGMEGQVEAGEKIALANDRGTDTAQFEAELDTAQAQALTAGEAYGFEECGQEPTSGTTTGPSVPAEPTPGAPEVPAEPAPGGGVGEPGGDAGGDAGGGGGGVSPGGGGVGPG